MGTDDTLRLEGQISEGLGEGASFVELEGYQRQFSDLLGYDPYPGTLNVELAGEGLHSLADLESIDPLIVEGWNDGERDYGPVHCYPAELQADDDVESVHIVRPVRTRHDDEMLEILAPVRLRRQLDLNSGNQVTVVVTKNY